MKRFKQYITEAGVNTYANVFGPELSIEEALQTYKKQLLEYIQGNTKIYRGMRSSNIPNICIGDGNKIERISANADSNLYTVLMSDILPEWKEYPKRNKSFICAATKEHGMRYGGAAGNKTYVVIPLENQKIGICSQSDLWFSFPLITKKVGVSSLNSFIWAFEKLYAKVMAGYPSASPELINFFNDESKSNTNNPTAFMAAFKEFDKALVFFRKTPEAFAKILLGTEFYVLTDEFLKPGVSILNILSYLFDPEKNDFLLMNASNYYTSGITANRSEHEVWLTGKTLFIRVPEYLKIEDQLEVW